MHWLGPRVEMKPERYAVDRKYPRIYYVPENAEFRVLVQDEAGEALCHVGIYRRDVTWNGRKVPAAGIGGVLTREDARGRGYASVALDAATQTLKHEGSAAFALLFCEPHNAPFYIGRGWTPFAWGRAPLAQRRRSIEPCGKRSRPSRRSNAPSRSDIYGPPSSGSPIARMKMDWRG